MYVGIQVKYPLFLPDFKETLILSTEIRKIPDINFYENPSSGSRVVPRGRADRRTDTPELIVAFHKLFELA